MVPSFDIFLICGGGPQVNLDDIGLGIEAPKIEEVSAEQVSDRHGP